MTVVRMITYEGSRSDIEEQLARSMKDGVNRPRIGVEITVATVFDSTKVIASKSAFEMLGNLGPVLPKVIRLTGTDIKKMNEGSDVIDDTEDSITKIISRHVSKNIRKAKERK